jgi:hypothetical protein
VDEQGNGTVAEPRVYQLIGQLGPVADRQFEIQFLDPGVEVFVFTFGYRSGGGRPGAPLLAAPRTLGLQWEDFGNVRPI